MRPAKLLLALAVSLGLALGGGYLFGRSLWVPVYQQVVGKQSLAQVMETYGPRARSRLAPYFERAGVAYPPSAVTLLAIKDQALLELWAEGAAGPRPVRSYRIRGLSGQAGPKLREGDRQVPEGIYRIIGFNPNSAYHLSMKLDYPNTFDLRQAEAEGRTEPGSNIFIHGKAVSIGCLAMGDPSIEELFVLAQDVGKANIGVAIAPTDPRVRALPTGLGPVWVSELYRSIDAYFAAYKHPEAAGRPAPNGPRGDEIRLWT